ncbi:MAG: type II toxin-antitoxin system HicB family antitoxin [Gammaproteobacteria bacterium]|nr:type II toxin-antitoxin system HicB family antitoxin [Gammaproteobacteria bacterium]
MIYYPAVIEYDRADDAYNVSFPDLPGCLTFGDTLEEAKENAREALSAYLGSIDSRKLKVPASSEIAGDNVFPIEPETSVGFAIWLKRSREARGMSQSDVAKQLGIAYQTYQRIEDPAKSNPTLKTIVKLQRVFNHRLVHIE